MTISAFTAKIRGEIELVNARPYVNRQHWLSATQHNIMNRLSFTSYRSTYLFFHKSFFLSIQMGINYVCCCKFTSKSGLTGTATNSRPVSWDCSKLKNERFSWTHFLNRVFSEETGDDGARYCSLTMSVPLVSSFCLSFSVTHSASHFCSPKFPPLIPFYHPC